MPTLRSGDAGEHVRTVQELLTAAGFPVTVDGRFGPLTLDALCEFQLARGLPITGEVNEATWEALRSRAS